MKSMLFAAVFLTIGTAAIAQNKPVLPLGTWGRMPSGAAKPACKPDQLIVIEQDRIVHNVTEGQGRCKVVSLKLKGKIIFGIDKCEWDKSVPVEETEPVDGEPGFSIRVQSPTRILYNNTNYGLCPLNGRNPL